MARKSILEPPASLTKDKPEILYKAAKDPFFFFFFLYVVRTCRGNVNFN